MDKATREVEVEAVNAGKDKQKRIGSYAGLMLEVSHDGHALLESNIVATNGEDSFSTPRNTTKDRHSASGWLRSLDYAVFDRPESALRERQMSIDTSENKLADAIEEAKVAFKHEDRIAALRADLDRIDKAFALDARSQAQQQEVVSEDEPGDIPGPSEPESTLETEPKEPPEEPAYSRVETEPAPIFYSALRKAIDAKMPKTAIAKHVMAIVTNPQSGVKADEVLWSGLRPWLESLGETPVSKAAVLEFLDANAVSVSEKMLGESTGQLSWERIGNIWIGTDEAGFRTAKYHIEEQPSGRFLLVSRGGQDHSYATFEEAASQVQSELARQYDSDEVLRTRPPRRRELPGAVDHAAGTTDAGVRGCG